MHNTNRFWVLVFIFTAFLGSNLYIFNTSVKLNQVRITSLEKENDENKLYIRNVLEGIEARSTKTAEMVVEAITELTTVFRSSQQNDQKALKLLEAIHAHLQERDNAE